MLDIKKITETILAKQGFTKDEITEELFGDTYETISDYYITNITAELNEDERPNFLFMIKTQTPADILLEFCKKRIDNYDQFVIDLTFQLEKTLL